MKGIGPTRDRDERRNQWEVYMGSRYHNRCPSCGNAIRRGDTIYLEPWCEEGERIWVCQECYEEDQRWQSTYEERGL